ncbi:MAG: hypothetical protein NZ849_09225 [Meiothermus sp.]|uniref:hypothetical protein n=1 Tax=Meiothermus sp. TaxID=1955249 RepID=UPI0025DC3074|nr:hypothetical protein [Meiothermus sp.]MCS7058900.1 hypothetical protein [Meiothermus sp.]MCS7195071.1 hypothetical protein [Meiothermus sp.]MCX7740053.1 hypothetical protein [Meiothermus sp.]MDW8090135.1 hypothetical protein [Meiothermus sp.]MDW8481437.1 hypothetical protein [Meiothermus sp.]
MSRILLGLGLVVLSVLLSLVTLALWYQSLPSNPAGAWLVFTLGFLVVSAAALAGVWSISRGFRGDRDDEAR